MGYTTIDELPSDWPSYDVQETVNGEGAPTEQTIQLIKTTLNTDIVTADNKLRKKNLTFLNADLKKKRRLLIL